MKFYKKAFTLAEILLAVGIIGVLAVITTPMLAKNVAEQKDRALLEKAKAQITLGNQNIIQVSNMNSASGRYTDLLAYIRAIDLDFNEGEDGVSASSSWFVTINNKTPFFDVIPGYWGIVSIPSSTNIQNRANLGDYMFYRFKNFPAGVAIPRDIQPLVEDVEEDIDEENLPPENDPREPKTVLTTILIDANGWNKRPNVIGNDVFEFDLLNNGSLVPHAPAEN